MKKKTCLLLLNLVIVLLVGAQRKAEFKPFKVDISAGYALPQGSGAKGGAILVAEPKYGITDQLSAGLRFELAVMARGYNSTGSSSSSEFEVKGSGSYLLTGDYYFSKKYAFRLFVGAGLGIYSLAAGSTVNGGVVSSDVDSRFGQMARAGFESGHLRFGVEYNLVPDTELVNFGSTSITKSTSKNSYLGLKIGVVIGGGRKK